MNLQVDIHQCSEKHIHVVLRGQAEGKAAFGNLDAFTIFVKICQEFVDGHTPIPKTFLDAFDDKD